jgi:hypothetical protein
MPHRRTPRTRAEYAGLFLPSIGAALTCGVLYVALGLSLAAGGALSGAAAVVAAIATCELDRPNITGYRDRDLRLRDLRRLAFFVAAWALCTAVAALTHDAIRSIASSPTSGRPCSSPPAPASPGLRSAVARFAPPTAARTSAASPRSSSRSRWSRRRRPRRGSERGQPELGRPSPTLRHERPRQGYDASPRVPDVAGATGCGALRATKARGLPWDTTKAPRGRASGVPGAPHLRHAARSACKSGLSREVSVPDTSRTFLCARPLTGSRTTR